MYNEYSHIRARHLVYRKIQSTTIMIGYTELRKGFEC